MDPKRHSRQSIVLLTSFSSIALQAVQIIGNFAYRTIFLMVLSKEYLGINGLFTNILQLFSLAELGIGTAILYNMYQAFAQHDEQQIGALIRFYKHIYMLIGGIVAVMGLCFYPFLGKIINTAEVPADVNLTVIYFLFVARSVCSYLFVYKQSILSADQRVYLVTLFETALILIGYVVKTIALFISKNFTTILVWEILITTGLNWLFSLWITHKYSHLFQIKAKLPLSEQWGILKNTFGLLCHRIGAIVVTSTDNIILSKYISLVSVGLYSNYATIVTAITTVGTRILGSFVPTVANFVMTRSKDDSHTMFNRILFANLWLTSWTTICLYFLLSPFIELWLDSSFLLPGSVVLFVCLQHYLMLSRLTADNYISSCGLFMLDRVRPLIEAFLNLSISIFLAKRIGIAGVFIGTCVSNILTCWWRQPHLVFKKFFQRSSFSYWINQLKWFVLTAAICVGMQWLFRNVPLNFSNFVLRCFTALILPNAIILLFNFNNPDCHYFLQFIRTKILHKSH